MKNINEQLIALNNRINKILKNASIEELEQASMTIEDGRIENMIDNEIDDRETDIHIIEARKLYEIDGA